MTWIEKKKNWLPNSAGMRDRDTRLETGKKNKLYERVYTVGQAADILGVDRSTVLRYLSLDEPEGAVIPPEAWYRLPGGHIRIREWILIKLKEQN